jgi:hypothetical protein
VVKLAVNSKHKKLALGGSHEDHAAATPMIRVVAISVSSLLFALMPGVVPMATAAADQSVRTESGQVRCGVTANDQGHGGGPLVDCQMRAGYFPKAPPDMNIVAAGATGALNWYDGNIAWSPEAVAQDIVLNYGQTYDINGWTILSTFNGTRFTNDGTGHGMFVSIQNVYSL